MSSSAASGRVECAESKNPTKSGVPSKSANDSYGQDHSTSSRRYITRAEVVALDARLSERERACLLDVGRLGTATGRQLERLHYGSHESGRRLARVELARLTNAGVLQRLTRTVGGVRGGSRSHVYALGLAGQRILYPDRQRYRAPWTPQPSYVRHALNVSELYVALREAERIERLELVAYDTEPRCWRSFAGPGGAMVTLKPDAFAALYHGDWESNIYVEVDLATEDGNRILAKARTYVGYWRSGKAQATGLFPLICWVVTTEQRRSFLERTFQRLPESERALFTVTTREHFIDHIIAPTPPGNQAHVTPLKEVNQ
ncbi:MAG: replication-relaxation family protein [Rhizomicrobium sp.]